MRGSSQQSTPKKAGVISAIARQLPGGGPLMWMMPLHMLVNEKPDDADDDDRNHLLQCDKQAVLIV